MRRGFLRKPRPNLNPLVDPLVATRKEAHSLIAHREIMISRINSIWWWCCCYSSNKARSNPSLTHIGSHKRSTITLILNSNSIRLRILNHHSLFRCQPRSFINCSSNRLKPTYPPITQALRATRLYPWILSSNQLLLLQRSNSPTKGCLLVIKTILQMYSRCWSREMSSQSMPSPQGSDSFQTTRTRTIRIVSFWALT